MREDVTSEIAWQDPKNRDVVRFRNLNEYFGNVGRMKMGESFA
jgi:hypothetical protein